MSDLVTVAVPGLPAAGPINGNELMPIHQNGRMVRARHGDLFGGGAAFLDRVAAAAITAGTCVVGVRAQMVPADPFNLDHCGRLLGILTADVGKGATGRVQSFGSMVGLAVPVGSGSDVLVVGADGALARATPVGAVWRQIVARADAATAIVIAPGEASLIYADTDALLTEGGFNTPCPLDRGADIAAFGYVTQAANARAFIAALAGVVPEGLPPRRGQFLIALQAMFPGSASTLFGAVPSDPTDPDHLAYWHTIGVTPSCRLVSLVKRSVGLTDAQVAAVITSARSIPE